MHSYVLRGDVFQIIYALLAVTAAEDVTKALKTILSAGVDRQTLRLYSVHWKL
jgi:hypothetical protein